MKTKYFVHNGKLITASSKKEAIHQIMAKKETSKPMNEAKDFTILEKKLNEICKRCEYNLPFDDHTYDIIKTLKRNKNKIFEGYFKKYKTCKATYFEKYINKIAKDIYNRGRFDSKVVASKSKSQDLENYLVKMLKSCIDENFIRANSKEIEDILGKEGFYWNSRKGKYEYEIYKDYSDELEPWWFEENNVDSFDAYWDALFNAYLDAGTQPYYDAAKAISEFCAENDVEVDDDDIKDCLQDEITCEYPSFLDDEIPCTITVKATDEVIKLVFGTSSLINIASKFVKGSLRPDLQECLKEYLLTELNENDLKDVSAVKSELESLKRYNYPLFGYNDCMITVREYLSTQNPKDDRASKFLELNDEFYFAPDAYYGAKSMFKLNAKIPIEYIDCRVGRHDF